VLEAARQLPDMARRYQQALPCPTVRQAAARSRQRHGSRGTSTIRHQHLLESINAVRVSDAKRFPQSCADPTRVPLIYQHRLLSQMPQTWGFRDSFNFLLSALLLYSQGYSKPEHITLFSLYKGSFLSCTLTRSSPWSKPYDLAVTTQCLYLP